MKIWGEVPKVSEVYNKQNRINKINKSQGVKGSKDIVSISGQAKDFQTVLKALRETPDIRQEKVNELTQKYQSGTYAVEGKEIADKILKNILDKKI